MVMGIPMGIPIPCLVKNTFRKKGVNCFTYMHRSKLHDVILMAFLLHMLRYCFMAPRQIPDV